MAQLKSGEPYIREAMQASKMGHGLDGQCKSLCTVGMGQLKRTGTKCVGLKGKCVQK